MHSIFAIEPSALKNWNDVRYITEKFGLSHGQLIGRYPKKWLKMVYESCQSAGIGDVELSRIETRLQTLKSDKLTKIGTRFDPLQPWLTNALSDDLIHKVSVILTKEYSDGERCFTVTDAEEDIFLNNRDRKIKRTSDDLASTIRFIVINATNLNIVDPYFQAKAANIKVLSKILDLCVTESAQELEICIHTALSKNNEPLEELKTKFVRSLGNKVLERISLYVVRWEDECLDFDFHARYAVSNTGGIRVDRGFNEPEPHDEREKDTDVVCMDEQRRLEIFELYDRSRGNPGMIDAVRIF